MDAPTILPTHTCFDDAMEVIDAVMKEGDPRRFARVRLVHGICLAPEGEWQGMPFAHAWIEEDGYCVQAGILRGEKTFFGVTRKEFYAALQPQVTTVYTIPEALTWNLKTLTFGPWESTYRDLCKDGDRRIFQ